MQNSVRINKPRTHSIMQYLVNLPVTGNLNENSTAACSTDMKKKDHINWELYSVINTKF